MTMTAEQLAQLREVAERANTPGSLTSYSKATALMEFDALITPDITLALLDELERKDKLIAELEAISSAAEKLVHCKGRYHSEQNYRALAALFGVTTPYLPPLESEARTVTVKLPAHKYRECVNGLLEEAIAYAGTQQLRERLSSRLANFVQPDHPHTRCAAGINLTVEG